MFSKILIANRGEIACRVIKTARRMGIGTVAVYSDADKDALHVRMADEAVYLGPPPAAQSYLLADKILEAIKSTGAEAVHPGYGFLSENADFAKKLEKAGVAFIGPSPKAIEAMGDKIESKRLAQAAKVNVVPGHVGVIKTADEAVEIAKEIGFPVMIKASAGGGGKGMRIAHNAKEVKEGFASATNEAKSSFADDRVFIERYIVEPRHIEIQVLGDRHGNIVYLWERECSIQRRHQKVIEEAPSPFLDEKTRAAMGEQAVQLAKAVGYSSAGTVEFIVDRDRNFFFLEMNTRLQVEHPVTEMITGLDLVEQMIRVAAGEKLGFSQKDVALKGWAIESRIYAEDPLRGFLPSIGRLARYKPPVESDSVRVDTGVYEGAEITMFYDPMIAKLVTYGHTRAEAIERQQAALDAFYIRGIGHNVPFLSAVMAHPRFVEGRLSTAFIAQEYPDGFHGAPMDAAMADLLIAVAAVTNQLEEDRARQICGRVEGAVPSPKEWVVALNGETRDVEVHLVSGGGDVTLNGRTMSVRTEWHPGLAVFEGKINGKPVTIELDRLSQGYRVSHAGVLTTAIVRTKRATELAARMPEKIPADLSKFLLCPMPGSVVKLLVGEGEAVQAGQNLAVVEAMKMENVLKATQDGTVSKVCVEVGDNLSVDQVIMEFE